MNFRPTIFVRDDFIPNPDPVREFALSRKFETVEYDGHNYAGIGQQVDPTIEYYLRILMGEIRIRMSFYRLSPEDDIPTAWVHCDPGCGEYACVLYLSVAADTQRGTAFWMHRSTRLDRIPTQEELEQLGMDVEEFEALMTRDANNEKRWLLRSLIGLQYNRLLIYRAELFHSRFPYRSFGADKQAARLIWVGFFDAQ